MKENHKLLSKWILIVSGIFALIEVMASLSIIFSPESVIDNIDYNSKGTNYLLYMWGTRQFALGFILAFATIKKSVPMLILAYIFLLVMFFGDLLIGINQNETSLIVGALVMCGISFFMLKVLYKTN